MVREALPGSRTEPSKIKESGQATYTAGEVAGQRLDSDGYQGQSNAPYELVNENGSEGLLLVFCAGRLDLYEGVA
jgi:hypothetical protein